MKHISEQTVNNWLPGGGGGEFFILADEKMSPPLKNSVTTAYPLQFCQNAPLSNTFIGIGAPNNSCPLPHDKL